MSDPVVGSAFVEVHARAAAQLDSEMQGAVNSAAAKVSTTTKGFVDDGSVAKAREGLAFWKKELENVDTSDLAKVQNLSESVAGWQDELASRAKIAGVELGGMGAKGAGAIGSIGTAAQVALPIILAIGGAAAAAIAAFQDQATKGLFGEADRAEAEAFQGELSQATDNAQEFAATIGAELVPALTDMLETLNDVFEVVNDNDDAIRLVTRSVLSIINPLGEARRQWREYRGEAHEASTVVDGLTDSVTLLTVAQERNRVETERAKESQKRATDELDRRIDATVRALEAELERTAAADRIVAAQLELAGAQAEVNDSQGRAQRAHEAVTEALRRQRDALQAVADAAQNVIESDRAVEEARRKVAEAEFRMGHGSQAAIDARNELQSAEFDAKRAREESADAAEDAGKTEAEVAEARKQEAKEYLDAVARRNQAQKDLDDAVRTSARVEADYEIAQREARGETVNAKDALELYRQKLQDVADKAGPALRDEIGRIQRALEALPSTKTIEIRLNTAKALEDLSQFAAQVPDAVGLALTDIATGAPLAGVDSTARAGAVTAPQTVSSRSTGPVQVQQFVTETSDPVQMGHELQWNYTP